MRCHNGRRMSDSTPRILYIAGAGRSGTTLLAMLLGELPACVSVGEVRHMWQRGVRENQLCACGHPFAECPFWTAVGERAFGGWDASEAARQVELLARVDRLRHFPQVAVGGVSSRFRAELREYAERQRRVYVAVAGVSGRRVIVESSKSPTYAVTLRAVAGMDVDVIHLVRDSRAVAYSWTRTRVMPEIQDRAAHMATFRPAQASLTWLGNNLAIDSMWALGLHPTVMRYEALARDPVGEIERVLRPRVPEALSAGLDRLKGPSVEVGTHHTVAGNPMRFSSGRLTLAADEEWRARMPRADRRLVAAMTAPLLARYGYPLSGR
jgi:hypothetical protein